MKYIKITPQQKQQAKDTDLISFLSVHHSQIIVYNSKLRRYEHAEHDSCVIEHSFWYHFSKGVGGDSIEFLTHFLNYSFADAVLALCNASESLSLSDNVEIRETVSNRSKSSLKAFWMPPRCEDTFQNVFQYLFNRGISSQTIQKVKDAGLLYSDRFSNCCFVNDNLSICFQRSTTDNRKGIRAKKEFEFWSFPALSDTIQKIYVCESPIDAMSLYDVMSLEKKENAAFVSMFGLKPAVVNRIANTYTSAEVVIAVDWDDAGNKFYSEKFPFYRRMICPHNFFSRCKDWNEFIQIYKKEGHV